jgi:hypothetical protein
MMPLQRAEGCLTDLTFDAWSSGELDMPGRERAATHVALCEHCRRRQAQLEAGRTEFYAAAPSFSEHTLPTLPALPTLRPAPKRPQRGIALASLAALAATLFFMSSPPPGTRHKGGPSLGYFVKRGEHVFEGDRGTALQPGDLIRFTYSSQQPRYLALFGWDSRSASVYFPSNSDRAARVQSQADVGLDFSLELDATQSDEQVHALFCQDSYEIAAILQALRNTGQLPVPPNCQKISVSLRKALTP